VSRDHSRVSIRPRAVHYWQTHRAEAQAHQDVIEAAADAKAQAALSASRAAKAQAAAAPVLVPFRVAPTLTDAEIERIGLVTGTWLPPLSPSRA
jgi:regulator of protease activity HflC (stomatin/prohibitin superfamily)